MFKNLTELLNSDCQLIKFNNELVVYPIFKNGRSSLKMYAKENNLSVYLNYDIKNIDNVTVFLRDPIDRFVSGVNTFFYFNKTTKIDLGILKNIELGTIVNKHFAPQYIWLLALYKHFRNNITIRPVSDVYKLVPNRDGPWTENPQPWIELDSERRNTILSINHKQYTACDNILIKKYMNTTVNLETIVKDIEIKNVLS